jgi:hypothetical protein
LGLKALAFFAPPFASHPRIFQRQEFSNKNENGAIPSGAEELAQAGIGRLRCSMTTTDF